MSNRSRHWEGWGLLFAIVVFVAGCDSRVEEGDYRSFGSLPENETSTPAPDESEQPDAPPTDETNVTEAKPVPNGNRADGASDPAPQVSEKKDLDDPPPLVAVRPVFAETSQAIKGNIENTASGSSGEREIKLLIKEKSFTPEGPENSLRVSYDDFDLLKILNMEPVPLNAVEYFPEWLAALDGKRVRVRGFMYPPFKEEGLEQFILARDNQICCFGKNPKIYDLVYVSMRNGVTAKYIQNRPFDVVGTFRIRPDAEGGEWFSLYELDDAIVIDR